MEKTLDITLDELLNKLGKTKEDLVMELDELNKWMEITNYRHGFTGMEGFVSLGYMFYKKKVFEGKVDDVLNRADDWGYDISWEEAEEVVILLQETYDCTISVYRAAVDYLIHVCIEDWDNITSYEKPLEKQRFVETLIHKTKDNPNVAYDFDVHFYKFPCYLRRGAISEAIGKVSSYKSNFASWKANPQGEAPSVPKAGYIY